MPWRIQSLGSSRSPTDATPCGVLPTPIGVASADGHEATPVRRVSIRAVAHLSAIRSSSKPRPLSLK